MESKIPTQRKPLPERLVLLYLSIYLLVFFSWVLAVITFHWEATILGVFWELLMLPSLALLFVVTGYTSVRWLRTGQKPAYLRVILILIIPWSFLAWLTFISW